MQEHIADLYGHFQSQSIHTNLYASSWFLTLFTTSLPIHLSCRIMDCFLADGIEAIFRLALYRVIHHKLILVLPNIFSIFQIRLYLYIIPTWIPTFYKVEVEIFPKQKFHFKKKKSLFYFIEYEKWELKMKIVVGHCVLCSPPGVRILN